MDKHLTIEPPNELLSSSSSSSAKPQRLFIKTGMQDEEESDCPLLTPSPPASNSQTPSDMLASPESTMFSRLDNDSPAIQEIKTAVATALTINNNSSNNNQSINGEASSRDPMVESSSSEESRSLAKEPVCTQLLTQLNTAYQHLAPDAQAIFYSQENGGKAPLVGIQVIMPKSPKDFAFTQWNWPYIRRICFWLMIALLSLATTIAVRGIITMPRRCDPPTEWWQGKLFYEIFPASFQDSSTLGDGIGDLRGITTRISYLKNLGVKTVHLNSILQSTHYPEHYMSVTNLTNIDENVGTMADFDQLIDNLHKNDIKLVLDIPVHSYINSLPKTSKKLTNAEKSINMVPNDDNTETKQKRSLKPEEMYSNSSSIFKKSEPILKLTANSLDNHGVSDLTSNSTIKKLENSNNANIISNFTETNIPTYERYILPASNEIAQNSLYKITLALIYWSRKNVDGFYLKGIEHYVDDTNFLKFLANWRDLLGPQRILICNWKVLEAAKSTEVKDKLLQVMDLIDVTLKLENGTKELKTQVESVLTRLFVNQDDDHTARSTWIHWSVGSTDTSRIASTLPTKNASSAAMLLSMMLPGTPSIFYGDEIGMMDCPCEDHKDLENLHNLSPMPWSSILHNKTEKFSSNTVMPWIPLAPLLSSTSMDGAAGQMINVRENAAPIYVEAARKHDRVSINCEVRYAEDELIIIERWYPRQNTYILVANFGNSTQKKDFSSLYYEGDVVVGPNKKLQESILFKEFVIAPGEAFVIKLKK